MITSYYNQNISEVYNIAQTRKHYKNKICLEVSSSNIFALKLYGYLGFKKVRVKKGYYQDSIDATLMDLYI